MTDPSSPIPEAEPRRLSPFLIVAAIAVVAFLAALMVFRGGGSSSDDAGTASAQGPGCGNAKPDPAYSVAMSSDPDPPKVEGTTFHLTVRHDGRSVSGAKVCLTADMSGMHHEGINNTAKETSNGTYDVTLKFGMRGPYVGTVVITEPGRAPASVPLTFQVD